MHAKLQLSTTLMCWMQSLQTAKTACDSPTMWQQHVYAQSLCLSVVRGRWKDRDGARRGGDFIGGGLAACSDTDNGWVKCLVVRWFYSLHGVLALTSRDRQLTLTQLGRHSTLHRW